MAYLGSWKIDDVLTFYCNTSDPADGAALDADAVPGYRIYEDETGTPIVTGSMALLDDANTVGFYSEQVTLSAANGFEKGKCYCVRITATVDSVAMAATHTLQIEAEVDCNTASDLHADLDDGGRLDLLVDAIKAKTDNLPADPADDSDIDTQLAAIAAYLDTEVAAILADTNELQTDWTNGGRLDLLIDAILADTGTDGVAISSTVRNAIADAVLSRGVDNVEDTADVSSLAGLILAAFESAIVGTTWTIRKTGGTTFATKTVTTNSAADPITGVT